MDDLVAELGADSAQAQHDVAPVPVIGDLPALGQRGLRRQILAVGRGYRGHHTPASRKMTEKIASRTMTQKMDSTTDLVVSWPTLSALPLT